MKIADVLSYVSSEETGRWKILTWMVVGVITFPFLKMQIRTTQFYLCGVNVMAENCDIGKFIAQQAK